MIPKISRISQWDSATEIIYKCKNCGIEFNFYGQKELYCHNCGIKNKWDNLPEYVSKEFSKKYHNASYEEQCEMIKLLNSSLLKIQSNISN